MTGISGRCMAGVVALGLLVAAAHPQQESVDPSLGDVARRQQGTQNERKKARPQNRYSNTGDDPSALPVGAPVPGPQPDPALSSIHEVPVVQPSPTATPQPSIPEVSSVPAEQAPQSVRVIAVPSPSPIASVTVPTVASGNSQVVPGTAPIASATPVAKTAAVGPQATSTMAPTVNSRAVLPAAPTSIVEADSAATAELKTQSASSRAIQERRPAAKEKKNDEAGEFTIPAGTPLRVNLTEKRIAGRVQIGFSTPIPISAPVTVEPGRVCFLEGSYDAMSFTDSGTAASRCVDGVQLKSVTVDDRTYDLQTDAIVPQRSGEIEEGIFKLRKPLKISITKPGSSR